MDAQWTQNNLAREARGDLSGGNETNCALTREDSPRPPRTHCVLCAKIAHRGLALAAAF